MSRPIGSLKTPAYRLHRPSGRAVVTLSGRDVYLGQHGTKESRDAYNRALAEWLAAGRNPPSESPDLCGQLIVELCAAYWKHAEQYHAGASKTAGELAHIRTVLHHLKRLYGRVPVADFGPLALKAMRAEFVRLDWSRNYTNAQVNRLRRFFKWGVENERVSAIVYQALMTVPGLRRGKTDARETKPVRPAPDHLIEPVRSLLSPMIQAMIDVQLLTGCRPGEVCQMRSRDVDTSGRIWTYRPKTHKTEHHEHERTVYIGPKAQQVLAPLLKRDLEAYLFSPADSESWRREKMSKDRKTPLSCGNRPGTNVVRKPLRHPGDRYTVAAYRQAIARACRRAFPVPVEMIDGETDTAKQLDEKAAARAAWRKEHLWKPHQLRHNAGTRLRKDFGLEAAQVILGHRTLTVTQVYAERNQELGDMVMGKVG